MAKIIYSIWTAYVNSMYTNCLNQIYALKVEKS